MRVRVCVCWKISDRVCCNNDAALPSHRIQPIQSIIPSLMYTHPQTPSLLPSLPTHLVHGEAHERRDELDGVSILAREEHQQDHHPETRLAHAGARPTRPDGLDAPRQQRHVSKPQQRPQPVGDGSFEGGERPDGRKAEGGEPEAVELQLRLARRVGLAAGEGLVWKRGVCVWVWGAGCGVCVCVWREARGYTDACTLNNPPARPRDDN